jgi:copper transport protein
MRLLRALLAAVLALALTAAPAGAHATIVRTVPADTALLKTAPRDVQIRWSESVDLGDGAVRLLDVPGTRFTARRCGVGATRRPRC